MSDYGIRVNLPDSEEVVFDTSRKTLKVQSGATPAHSDILSYTFQSEPATGTTNLFTIAHGYSYKPMALVFWSTDQDTFYLMPATFNTDLPSSSNMAFSFGTTNTSLIIDFIETGTSPATINGNTYYFKYYITTEDGFTD